MGAETLEDLILKWNTKYPYDKWWREKYNVPFQSEEHLNANPLWQKAEYLEDKLYNKAIEEKVKEIMEGKEDSTEKQSQEKEEMKVNWAALDKQIKKE